MALKFNKISTPVYSAVTAFSMNSDGSISATYVIGTDIGTDTDSESGNDGEVADFSTLVTEYKYLDPTQAHAIFMTPFKQEDIGKSYQDLMLGRIYSYMLENQLIKV